MKVTRRRHDTTANVTNDRMERGDMIGKKRGRKRVFGKKKLGRKEKEEEGE